jgi:lambda family phage tail tape measure protein
MSEVNGTQYNVTVNADGVSSTLDRAAASFDNMGAKADTSGKRAATGIAAVEEATAKLGSVTASQSQQIDKFVQSLLKQADTAGKTRAEILAMRAANMGIADTAGPIIAQINAQTEALRRRNEEAKKGGGTSQHGGISDGQFNNAMHYVPAQITDIVTQLQGGQKPLTVLIEQGGQLKDMFGGVGNAVKGVGMYLTGLVAAITPELVVATAVVGSIVAVAAAVHTGAQEQEKLQKAIQLSGNYAGVTTQQMNDLAASVRNISGSGDAQHAITGLLSTGKVSGSSLDDATRAVLDYAKAMDVTVDKSVAALGPIFDDPMKGALKLNETMHFLTEAEYDHMKALDDAGDKAGAMKVALDSLDAQVKANKDNLGYFARAWDSVSASISNAWAAMKNWGKSDTLQQQLATVQTRLAGMDAYNQAMDPGKVDKLKKQIADLQGQIAKEQQDANDKATQALIVKAKENTDKLSDDAMTNAQKRADAMQKANAEYATRIAEMRKNGTYSQHNDDVFAAQRDAEIADAAHKYKDPKPHKAPAVTESSGERYIDAVRKENAALREQQAIRAQLGDDTAKLLPQQQKLVEFNQQIADIQAKQASGQKLTKQQQSMLADQSQIRALMQANVEIAKQLDAQKQIGELKKKAASIDADIANYQASQTEQYQAQLDAIGKGTQAQREANDQAAIRKKYLQEQKKLDDDTPIALRGSDTYSKAQSDIQTGLKTSLDANAGYYAQLKSMQGDWLNGVKEGWANYVDTAANSMAQAQQIFSDVTNGLGNVFANFCETGKLDFKSLVSSILGDLAKIAAEKEIASIGSSVAGSSWGSSLGSALSSLHFAGGGSVRGAGTGTSDSIPTMLSDGEYVIKAAAVDRVGVGALDAINSGYPIHQAAHFATGGLVSTAAKASGGSSAGGTNVAVTVNSSGGGLDKSDASWLQQQIQSLVDSRMAAKMKGQGGYMWQNKYGTVNG